jgi:hypothetical protein
MSKSPSSCLIRCKAPLISSFIDPDRLSCESVVRKLPMDEEETYWGDVHQLPRLEYDHKHNIQETLTALGFRGLTVLLTKPVAYGIIYSENSALSFKSLEDVPEWMI